ncbi:MAG: glycosyltransferase [Planctomycetes bacterium]|nr:glycosyltransferase [Planctomycetota bacterium]MCB9910658.1 glycosyltransferase [Planctomycetota bacterium]HPF15217.1 glycosyltransferase [Planctomycetota bacterium]HRV80822.1 glycosyltransferase [Planctomycetota bacterium]
MECTIGGTRRHLVDLALGQQEAGHEVAVVAAVVRDLGMAGDLERLAQAGVVVERLDMVREIRPLVDWKHYQHLCEFLRRWQPQIVHSHSSKAGVLARRASRRTGIGQRVHTPHTMSFLFAELFSPPKRALFRRIERGLAAHTARMIAVSPSEGDTLRRSGVVDPAKVRVVCNGIDPRPFQTATPTELAGLGLQPGLRTLALVGLVYAAKGHDLAIQALDDPELAGWQLLCVGPGDPSEYLTLAERLGLRERVHFSGARNDVPGILAAVDGLILPSRWEGMPYVVLEAMASGRVVLAHPVDGARDLVRDGETGFLCKSIGVEALRTAWRRLAAQSQEDARRMGLKAQAEVSERYTLASMVQGTLAVYSELL